MRIKFLRKKYASLVSVVKPPMQEKNAFKNAKRPIKPVMHHVSYNAKYTCHACNQVGHLKYDCPFKRKSLKCIWVLKGTVANNVGPKFIWVPKFSS